MTRTARTARTSPDPLAVAQDGLLTTSRLVALGLAGSTISRRCAPGGPWQRVLPRVILLQTGAPSPRQRLRAALLYAGEGALLTGVAALTLYEVRAAGPPSRPGPVDVLVPKGRAPGSRSYVRIRTARRPAPALPVRRLPCVKLPRAVSDAVPYLPDGPAVTALLAEVVQRGRCTLQELTAALRDSRRASDPRVVAALEGLTAGVRSVEEAEARRLLREAGIPDPLWNEPLYYPDGTFLACPDAHWPYAAVVLEIDSRAWHLSPGDWERTMTRRNLMTSQGLLVLSVSPPQLRADPAAFLTLLRTTLARAADLPARTVRRPQAMARPRAAALASAARARTRSGANAPTGRTDATSPRQTPHSPSRRASGRPGARHVAHSTTPTTGSDGSAAITSGGNLATSRDRTSPAG
ncbi:hypothetical protein ACIOHE_22835 [Streptomyces sp. NPDC087851]|uniref:hypothetical protein n=1 Tax=Streptomyces sp. NPDC087851 TaxID=3365810 RepID=UPI003820AB95